MLALTCPTRYSTYLCPTIRASFFLVFTSPPPLSFGGTGATIRARNAETAWDKRDAILIGFYLFLPIRNVSPIFRVENDRRMLANLKGGNDSRVENISKQKKKRVGRSIGRITRVKELRTLGKNVLENNGFIETKEWGGKIQDT